MDTRQLQLHGEKAENENTNNAEIAELFNSIRNLSIQDLAQGKMCIDTLRQKCNEELSKLEDKNQLDIINLLVNDPALPPKLKQAVLTIVALNEKIYAELEEKFSNHPFTAADLQQAWIAAIPKALLTDDNKNIMINWSVFAKGLYEHTTNNSIELMVACDKVNRVYTFDQKLQGAYDDKQANLDTSDYSYLDRLADQLKKMKKKRDHKIDKADELQKKLDNLVIESIEAENQNEEISMLREKITALRDKANKISLVRTAINAGRTALQEKLHAKTMNANADQEKTYLTQIAHLEKEVAKTITKLTLAKEKRSRRKSSLIVALSPTARRQKEQTDGQQQTLSSPKEEEENYNADNIPDPKEKKGRRLSLRSLMLSPRKSPSSNQLSSILTDPVNTSSSSLLSLTGSGSGTLPSDSPSNSHELILASLPSPPENSPPENDDDETLSSQLTSPVTSPITSPRGDNSFSSPKQEDNHSVPKKEKSHGAHAHGSLAALFGLKRKDDKTEKTAEGAKEKKMPDKYALCSSPQLEKKKEKKSQTQGLSSSQPLTSTLANIRKK